MIGINSQDPLVSVVIPSYNRARLLPNAIKSILLQDIHSLEIIIADDGSKDETEVLIKQLQLQYPFIIYLSNSLNLGEAAARNLGVKNAKGKYIAFLDSDDEWLPNKLKQQIDFLEKYHHIYDAIATNYYLVSPDEKKEAISPWFPKKEFNVANLLKYGCNVSFGSTVCIKRHIFNEVGIFDISLPIFVDLDWLCRFCEKGFKMAKKEDYLVNYYKAPMRKGEFLESGIAAFKRKNLKLLNSFSLKDRLLIESQFYNYVSLAYFVNGPFKKFLKTRTLYFLFNPFRNLGNYWHFLKTIIQYLLRKYP